MPSSVLMKHGPIEASATPPDPPPHPSSSVLMKHGPIEAVEVSPGLVPVATRSSVLMKHGPIEALFVILFSVLIFLVFRADEARPH